MPKYKLRPDERYGAMVNLGNKQYKYVCANSPKELDDRKGVI